MKNIMTAILLLSFASSSMAFEITSSAFNEGDLLNPKYTCNADNISPPLAWKNAPKNTVSFALIVDDPDALMGTFVHAVLFNIPATVQQLSENLQTLPSGSLYGFNSRKMNAYMGPCPPFGTHRYFFKLYALDIVLPFTEAVSRSDIEDAMTGHVLGTAVLMGRYKKQ